MDSSLQNLVVIEGAHGSGKTTIARSVVRELASKRLRSVYTKEPHSRFLLQPISSLSNLKTREPLALAYLVATDRILHIDNIRRWIQGGAIVIADRYLPSSLVYQRIDGLSTALINCLN